MCVSEGHSAGVVENYLATLRRRKYSPRTVQVYGFALEQLLLFLAASGGARLQDVKRDHLEKYRLHWVQRGAAPASLEVFLRAARLFFNWLEDSQIIFDNPAAGLIVPKFARRLLPVPTPGEMARLLSRPNLSTPIGIRDRALLEVGYSGALRREELVALTIFDPDLTQHTLRVVGKGRKERVVPLGRQAVKWLQTYIADARPKLLDGPDVEALWISKGGRPLGGPGLQAMIRLYAKAAEIKIPMSPHSLRRACATHMLQGGAHPLQIQLLLGHAGLKHLGQYLRLSVKDLKQAHQRSKPGA